MNNINENNKMTENIDFYNQANIKQDAELG